jgi:hypothetical protein
MTKVYTRVTKDNEVESEDEVQIEVGEPVTQVSISSKGALKRMIIECDNVIAQKTKEKAAAEAEILAMDVEAKKVVLKAVRR